MCDVVRYSTEAGVGLRIGIRIAKVSDRKTRPLYNHKTVRNVGASVALLGCDWTRNLLVRLM